MLEWSGEGGGGGGGGVLCNLGWLKNVYEGGCYSSVSLSQRRSTFGEL